MSQLGFFDLQNRLNSLSKSGDPLVLLKNKIQWLKFNSTLSKALKKDRKSNAGRKPYSPLLMFKILILQSLYNLSDEQMEFMIKDRLSFMRFLELDFNEKVPDEKTIWHYRELFVNANILEKLFSKFNQQLDAMGLKASHGTLIDASIVPVPIQRNKRDENNEIKGGSIPSEWKKKPSKLCQKDVDAHWTKKNGKSYYGYKMHINADNKHKLIRKVKVTTSSVHDSQVFEELICKNTSKEVWADSAYYHKRHVLPSGYREHIHRKGKRGLPLSEFQQALNKKRSQVRCRVEHVFGTIKGTMKLFVRTVGFKRAEAKVLLSSITYNMMRSIRIA